MDQKLLRSLGIPAGIIAGAAVVALGYYIYRSSLEVKLIKLQIGKFQREANDNQSA